ncbi:MAG: flagellar biosynthesis protein FlgA [Alphaproteobacteria bacterium]|nr:flagellar biosynthesis protein FlgA [Alphaproteobacteria bacterium]
MNLHALLMRREAEKRPLRVGLIGAGKFGTMFLAQALRTPGLHLAAIADLDPARARRNAVAAGWPRERLAARNAAEAIKRGATWVGDEAAKLLAAPLDVVIEATGDPRIGIRHALGAFASGMSVVMVNVEADALAGPLLARRARAAGVVYSLAYGDQPALICEQVDWARAAGFRVIAAGKGTKYLPTYHASTPDTVWGHYGITAEAAAAGGMNAQMFNSFLDGTKSGIEMAAVANATGLTPAPDGLAFPPLGVEQLAFGLRPRAEGGQLHHKGQVEVVSSLERDGRPVPIDLRWGTYVVFEGESDYVRRCFKEYGLITDPSGRYSALWRPYHLIGLELGISVASVGLHREATGAPTGFRADVAATAKRDLKRGEVLDGEGGRTVWGKLMPAKASLKTGALPLGLAKGVKLKRPVKQGAQVTWSDVTIDPADDAVAFRREMERGLGAA